jgi:hypothetical protein
MRAAMTSELDKWRELALGSVESVGDNLPADADWTPVILLHEPASGEESFAIMPMHVWVSDEEMIDISDQEGLPQVATALMKLEPRLIARIQMAWASTDTEVRPSEAEDREEWITVMIAGSNNEYEYWYSTVDRTGDHPQVVEWKRATGTGGAMADATRLAMAATGSLN